MERVIRQEVRNVIYEMMQNGGISTYPIAGSSNKFPKAEYSSSFVNLPSDINTKEDYLVNWENVSENQDLYGFPTEEFKKGIHVEKAKRNLFNILDIGEIVINNLKQNPQFYSNLGV